MVTTLQVKTLKLDLAIGKWFCYGKGDHSDIILPEIVRFLVNLTMSAVRQVSERLALYPGTMTFQLKSYMP